MENIPVVGHIKGGIQCAIGDEEGGKRALGAATKATFVVGAATGAFMVAGPVGAAAAGAMSSAIYDAGVIGLGAGKNDKDCSGEQGAPLAAGLIASK